MKATYRSVSILLGVLTRMTKAIKKNENEETMEMEIVFRLKTLIETKVKVIP